LSGYAMCNHIVLSLLKLLAKFAVFVQFQLAKCAASWFAFYLVSIALFSHQSSCLDQPEKQRFSKLQLIVTAVTRSSTFETPLFVVALIAADTSHWQSFVAQSCFFAFIF
ncbi:hypothetical protein T12_3977, partial [Trichinella patagoniensis]